MTNVAMASLIVGILFLAGCTARDDGTEPEPSPTFSNTASSTSTTTLPPDGERPSALPPERLLLTDCMGFIAVGAPRPRAMGPSSAPPGWEPDDPAVLATFSALYGYECQRVSIGPYERGPVRIVWDGHDNVDFPPDCLLNETTVVDEYLVNVFFISDAELATYLQATYGLPAAYVDIQVAAQSASAPRTLTWTWPTGQDESQMTVVDDGTSGPIRPGERMFWQRGQGIGWIDFIHDKSAPQLTSRYGYGTLRPPMLQSDGPDGAFAGRVDYITTNAEGMVRLHSDLLCKQPEPMG